MAMVIRWDNEKLEWIQDLEAKQVHVDDDLFDSLSNTQQGDLYSPVKKDKERSFWDDNLFVSLSNTQQKDLYSPSNKHPGEEPLLSFSDDEENVLDLWDDDEDNMLDFWDNDKDKPAAPKVDPALVDKYLAKVAESGLSLLDQPLYPEFTEKPPRYNSYCWIRKSRRPLALAHIDDNVWIRYYQQVQDSGGFDIVDFPGVTSETRIVPMNLDTNPEAIARAKGVADLAIKWYNDNNNTSYVVVSVDKANCNPELCTFVDSDKYTVFYKPLRECDCTEDAKKCFCSYLLSDDMFYITFTAKDYKSDGYDVTKVFQAYVVHYRVANKDVVTYCKEKVVGSSESIQNPVPERYTDAAIAKGRKATKIAL